MRKYKQNLQPAYRFAMNATEDTFDWAVPCHPVGRTDEKYPFLWISRRV